MGTASRGRGTSMSTTSWPRDSSSRLASSQAWMLGVDVGVGDHRLGEPGDPQPAGLTVTCFEEGRRFLRCPERVTHRTAGHHVEHRRGVADGSREGSVGGQADRVAVHRRSGDPTPCRLQPDDPATAAGIRIDPPPSEPCASGTSPADTADAEPPLEPPAISEVSHGVTAGGALGLGVAGRAEFRRVRLAQAHQPSRGDAPDHVVVPVGHVVGEHRRAEAGGHALGRVQVLDRSRYAGQGATPLRRRRAGQHRR